MVDNHAEAREISQSFLDLSIEPAAIIVGGGGGTLRAVIEGVCKNSQPGCLPGRDRIRIAALRMGSGNVLARRFGAPRDPEAALSGICNNLVADKTAPCCVIRYELGRRNGPPLICHSVTLAGFGQFGRVPGDLARWHKNHPLIHKISAKMIGIERLTNVEYAADLLLRSVACCFRPELAEQIRIINSTFRLLAGAVINFPMNALPFRSGVNIEEERISIHLIPLIDRWQALQLVLAPKRLLKQSWQMTLQAQESLDLQLTDRAAVEFFLDEDPQEFEGTLKIQVAGSVAFVPGPDYKWQ